MPQGLGVIEVWANRVVTAETQHLAFNVIVGILVWHLGNLLLFLFSICKR